MKYIYRPKAIAIARTLSSFLVNAHSNIPPDEQSRSFDT